METLINKVIKNKLADFTKPKEKNEIISYLVLLGCEYYSLLYNDQELNADNLKFLAKKYLNELNTSKPLIPHFNISLSDKRKCRPDSMCRYPFVDNKGSVQQILQTDEDKLVDRFNINNNSTSKMVDNNKEPIHRQYQSNMQIFDEMKFEDEANTKVNDFPETFDYEPEQQQQQPNHTITSRTRYRKSSPVITEEQQFIQNLKKVPSRISQIVQHDKRFYKQKVQERNQSALKTIAQRRLDALTSTAVPLGFKDRHYFSEPDPSLNYVMKGNSQFMSSSLHKTREPHLFHSKPMYNNKHTLSSSMKKGITTTANNYKRYSDLNTGSATMEIADAFLQGNVGREILTIPESDYSHYNSTQPGEIYSSNSIIPNNNHHSNRFERTTEALQGIHTRPGADTRYAANTNYTNRTSHYSAKSNVEDTYKKYIQPEDNDHNSYATGTSNYFREAQSQQYYNNSKGNNTTTNKNSSTKNIQPQQQHYMDYGLKTEHEKRIDQKLNEQAKRLYAAPGWKSSKGGWVADFGAPHTHALYTGPEINYPSRIPSSSTSSIAAVNSKDTNTTMASKVPSFDREITKKSFENQMIQSVYLVEDEEGGRNSDNFRSEVIYDPIPNTNTTRTTSTRINNDKNVEYNKNRFTSISQQDLQYQQNDIIDDGSFSIDTAVAGAGEGDLSKSVYRNEIATTTTSSTPVISTTISASEYIRNTTPSIEQTNIAATYYNDIRNSTPISNMDNSD